MKTLIASVILCAATLSLAADKPRTATAPAVAEQRVEITVITTSDRGRVEVTRQTIYGPLLGVLADAELGNIVRALRAQGAGAVVLPPVMADLERTVELAQPAPVASKQAVKPVSNRSRTR